MSAPSNRIGRYEIIEPLARGGISSVYLARDPRLDRLVALKLFSIADDVLRVRHAREARSAAQLHHPNIEAIFDVGEEKGLQFIAAEYIQGEPLAEIIHRTPSLPLMRKIQIVEEVSAGLEYAHKFGMVHRDINPSNIMVTSDGVAKILDFGAFRAAETQITQAGMILGAVNYLSPEQLTGSPIDGRSDVFALGTVLYELITGRKAFPGNLSTGVLEHIIADEPKPAVSLVPALPIELERIIGNSLQKDPSQRYQDAGIMRRDLSRVRASLQASEEIDAPTMLSPAPSLPVPSPKRVDREAIARRRVSQIEQHLAEARQSFDQGHFEDAIAACEHALILDPDNPSALDLSDRSREALNERLILHVVEEVRQQLRLGERTTATALLDQAGTIVPSLRPDSLAAIEVQRLRVELERSLAEDQSERRRDGQMRDLLARARVMLESGDYSASIQHVDHALALDPDNAEAVHMRRQLEQADREREMHSRDQALRAEEARRRAERAEAEWRESESHEKSRKASEMKEREQVEAARKRLEAEAAEARLQAEAEARRVPKPEIVPVFYATDRARTGRPEEAVAYGSERALSGLAYGCSYVSIPPGHRRGHLERPSILKLEFREDPDRHVAALNVTEYTKAMFFDLMRKAMAGEQERSTFVFIHGFNVDFDEAVRRTAQLGFDLGLRKAPILYSWPSQGSTLQYIADTNAAIWTVPHLAEFLRDLQEHSGATSIHLIAHSMGNQALTGALRILRADASLQLRLFKQVVLTAPDLDAHVFERDLAPQIVGIGERTTLYASSRDEVLTISKRLNAYRRAGDAADGIVVVEGVDSIDASQVSTGLGHSPYGDVRTVVEDLSLLLRLGLPPGSRNLVPRGAPPKQHWAFPA